jgi:hypothetical protein
MAQLGHGTMSGWSPVSGVKRKSDLGPVRSVFDPNADLACTPTGSTTDGDRAAFHDPTG